MRRISVDDTWVFLGKYEGYCTDILGLSSQMGAAGDVKDIYTPVLSLNSAKLFTEALNSMSEDLLRCSLKVVGLYRKLSTCREVTAFGLVRPVEDLGRIPSVTGLHMPRKQNMYYSTTASDDFMPKMQS